MITTSHDTGRTKTEVTRGVPVHPMLGKILAAWKRSHRERIYGRAPTADDLVVPTVFHDRRPEEAASGQRHTVALARLKVDAAAKHMAMPPQETRLGLLVRPGRPGVSCSRER